MKLMNGKVDYFVGNKIILFEKGLMVDVVGCRLFSIREYISDVFVKHDYMNNYQVVPDVGEYIFRNC